MNPWLFLFLGSVVVCVLQRRYIRGLREDLSTQKAIVKAQENAFGELLQEFNHSGPIPPASSALGLIGLTLSATMDIIKRLKDLYEVKDYNTSSVILDLHGIVHTELRMIYTALDDYLKSRRNTMKKYERYQPNK